MLQKKPVKTHGAPEAAEWGRVHGKPAGFLGRSFSKGLRGDASPRGSMHPPLGQAGLRSTGLHQSSAFPPGTSGACPAGEFVSLEQGIRPALHLWVAFVRSANTQGKGKCESLSRVRLSVTLGTVARQAPRPWDSPGKIFQTRIEFRPPALQADSLPFEPPGKPVNTPKCLQTGVCVQPLLQEGPKLSAESWEDCEPQMLKDAFILTLGS